MIEADFKNIGPIKDAKLKLGDLTIIAGQNNTGKTYLAYTLYGFLKLLNNGNFRHIRYSSDRRFFLKKTKAIIENLKETGKAHVEYKEFIKIKDRMISGMAVLFSSELFSEVFSSPNGEFKDSSFNIESNVQNDDLKIKHQVRIRGLVMTINISSKNKNCVFEIIELENTGMLDARISQGIDFLIYKAIEDCLLKPFILSTERFGISLFYKELDITKNRLVEELQKLADNRKGFDPFTLLERGSARYALPIKDNIEFTRDLAELQKKKSEILMDKSHSVDSMMVGYYKTTKEDEIRFISNRRKHNKFNIPLYLASSSARGLSDLYFYLKHEAKPGQLLIIDEPESHLSPTNQVLMARLLVFCVNSGLKVLITTHSDYLIKEINNLIMLNTDFKGKDSFIRSKKNSYTKEDYLDPEIVEAYICQDGELIPCTTDASGIDMQVFDDAIDSINKISNQLAWLTTNK